MFLSSLDPLKKVVVYCLGELIVSLAFLLTFIFAQEGTFQQKFADLELIGLFLFFLFVVFFIILKAIVIGEGKNGLTKYYFMTKEGFYKKTPFKTLKLQIWVVLVLLLITSNVSFSISSYEIGMIIAGLLFCGNLLDLILLHILSKTKIPTLEGPSSIKN